MTSTSSTSVVLWKSRCGPVMLVVTIKCLCLPKHHHHVLRLSEYSEYIGKGHARDILPYRGKSLPHSEEKWTSVFTKVKLIIWDLIRICHEQGKHFINLYKTHMLVTGFHCYTYREYSHYILGICWIHGCIATLLQSMLTMVWAYLIYLKIHEYG